MSKFRNSLFLYFLFALIMVTGIVSSVSAADFAPAVTITAGSGPSSVVTGHFDSDLNLDMAVVNYTSNTVSLFLGNGNGTFQDRTDIPAGTKPFSITSGDFDDDGDLDLAVANSGSNNVSILLNDGDGNFSPGAELYAAGTTPYSITTGDFDGDTIADLAIANKKSSSVSILLGNGDGTFIAANPASFIVASGPVSVVAGDFNNDGKDELAVAHFNTNSVSVASLSEDAGTHSLTTLSTHHVGHNPIAMKTSDFNGDGYADLVVVNSNSASVSVLLGMGNGNFTYPVTSRAGSLPSSVAVAYFNEDAFQDLVVSNTNDKSISVLYGNGNGRFQYPVKFTVGKQPVAVAAGDFTNDDMPDIVSANYSANSLSMLENLWATVITAPAPGEHIPSGTTYTVTWDPIAGISSYSLLYSSNNGQTFKTIAKSLTATSYAWKVPTPTTVNLDGNILKVVGYNGKNIIGQGVSPSSFSIDSVDLTLPSGGESWTSGDVHDITWTTYVTSKTATSAKLYYSTDGGTVWILITTITGNPGTYAWTVPTVTEAQPVLVRVELRGSSGIVGSDISDKFFTINPAP